MWPVGQGKRANRLGAIRPGEPGLVELVMSVASPNVVTSPITGTSSALLHIELLERVSLDQGEGAGATGAQDDFVSLGVVVLGEILILRDEEGHEIPLVVGRARFELAMAHGGTPMDRVPAELVPLLRRANGRGIVCYRESVLREGDGVRLKAFVEASHTVVASGYRSGSAVSYVVRDDLGAVVLEEVFEVPAL